MKMKKSFIVMGLMLAASALTNCSKDDTAATDASDLRQGFTLRAEYTPIASDTRTTLDPATGKVAWDAEDELLVFCRETGTEPASWEQYKFTTTEEAAAQGIFTCPDIAIDPAKSYDWYIMSPYSSYVKNPLGESNSGTFQIGNQTQDNAAPTAHLTNADLMTGVITGVAGDRQPVVTLAHRATLMKFTIVNKETEAITPATVEFEAPSNVLVGGRFAVDFATGVLTADTKWTSTKLTIENAPAIEPNGTYDIYMMMPPFTLASGDEFVITVTTDKGRSEQNRTMTREVKFEAGKMNSATIDFTKDVVKPIEVTLIDKIADLTAGTYFMAGRTSETSYFLWTGAIASQKDCETVPYTYNTANHTIESSDKANEIELVATGKPNTYYIKSGAQYLYSKSTDNRQLGLTDTPTEWVFSDKAGNNGFSALSNKVYLMTATNASSAMIRSYGKETQYTTGIFFFKKN